MDGKLERWQHLNMALIGGFLGTYAIVNCRGLFGSAQTGNMLEVASALVGGNFFEVLLRFLGVLCYAAGLASTVLVRYTKLNPRLYSIAVNTVCMILLGFLPATTNPIVNLYPLFFMTSVQWNTFKGADGYTSSCLFSTNNLRQFTVSLVEYGVEREQDKLRKTVFYGRVLLIFHIGAALGAGASFLLERRAAWCALILLVPALMIERAAASECTVLRLQGTNQSV